jgi:hypothetical protein
MKTLAADAVSRISAPLLTVDLKHNRRAIGADLAGPAAAQRPGRILRRRRDDTANVGGRSGCLRRRRRTAKESGNYRSGENGRWQDAHCAGHARHGD